MTLSLDTFHQCAVHDAAPKVATPSVNSFREFLEKHARVKTPDGSYAPYTFEGREALEFVVGIIDRVLGNGQTAQTPTPSVPSVRGDTGIGADDIVKSPSIPAPLLGGDKGVGSAAAHPISDARLTATNSVRVVAAVPAAISITDARLTATGSAQWGKTILELNLLAYASGLLFRSVGLFLPDEDLVEGVVDSKLRPDVLDQQPWLNSLITLGKAENASGKTVNRKGLFTCTDGKRKSHGMIHGMQKIPTTFSFDIVIEDEKDDIPTRMSKYLTARMTSSDLRFRLSIGTQRYAGAGQNKEFENGTMHIGYFACPECGYKQNPEENFPAICRLALDGAPCTADPQLTLEGNFRSVGVVAAVPAASAEPLRDLRALRGETTFEFMPDALFYLACVRCGSALDRHAPEFIAQHPEREKLHHWSIRISQLLVAAISLKQIVSDWCNNSVKDPDAMKTFYVDRLGLPRSNTQGIDQKILDRARSFEVFDLSLTPRPGTVRYAGLDTGDRCWLTVRECGKASVPLPGGDQGVGSVPGAASAPSGAGVPPVASGRSKRITWLEQLSAERVRARVPQIFETMGITTLFVDAGPLRDLARDLCFLLNGLNAADARQRIPTSDAERAIIHFSNGLVWDGRNQQWRGLRCAAVEFSLKAGKGIQHKLGITQDGLYYPIIACNRDETIERVVNELLTANENVIEMVDGRLRTAPAVRLPARTAGSPKVIETFDAHVISGSRRDRDENGNAEHFVDGCENHFLLSNAYSALAESFGEHAVAPSTGAMDPDTAVTSSRNMHRFGRHALARRTW